MKKHSAGLFFIGCLILGGFTSNLSLADEKALTDVPLSIHPRYDILDTELVQLFKDFSKDGDAIIISAVDTEKLIFRMDAVGIPRERLIVYTPWILPQEEINKEKYQSIKGLLLRPYFMEHGYMPSIDTPQRTLYGGILAERHGLPSLNFGLSKQDLGRFHANCHEEGLLVMAGLGYDKSRYSKNIYDLAANADVFVIYAPEILIYSAKKFRPYLERTIKRARKKNPDILIEVGIPVGSNIASTQMLAAVLEENQDLADRFGLYVDERPEGFASFIVLWSFLRPENRELGKLGMEKLKYLQDLAEQENYDEN